MARFAVFLSFVVLSVIAAGAFGILHDQISYSVSSEYYTRFKFVQFGLLDPSVPERIRAGLVGFLATWWMGLPLGILCGAAGFLQDSVPLMRRALSWSVLLAMLVTLSFAMGGLVYGYAQTASIDLLAYRAWFIPPDLEEPRRFLCAGYMHNAAYLGGAASVPAVWLLQLLFKRRRCGQRLTRDDPA